MRFERIILLGTGKLFLDCLSYVHGLCIPYTGYDMSDKPQKMTRVQAEKKGLSYRQESREAVYRDVREEECPLLLLSVINPCIVPRDILEKKNILALNCHQALLPKHKGRNAEAWAIYEGDTVTGITWHRMEPDVDTGDILIQKEVAVTEESTSCRLFREQLFAAYEAFQEFMPLVLQGKESYLPQKDKAIFKSQDDTTPALRYSYEVPGDGILDLSWDGAQISRFLRAVDYGGLPVMKPPVVCVDGKAYSFKSYRIVLPGDSAAGKNAEPDSVVFLIEEGQIIIRRQGYEFKLLKCQLLEQNPEADVKIKKKRKEKNNERRVNGDSCRIKTGG